MTDKQLIKSLEQVIEAQSEVIKAYQLINTLQKPPTIKIGSGKLNNPIPPNQTWCSSGNDSASVGMS